MEQKNTVVVNGWTLDVEDVRKRTQSLIDAGCALAEIVCFSAADYLHATRNENFAAFWGGIDKIRDELEANIRKWDATYVRNTTDEVED